MNAYTQVLEYRVEEFRDECAKLHITPVLVMGQLHETGGFVWVPLPGVKTKELIEALEAYRDYLLGESVDG